MWKIIAQLVIQLSKQDKLWATKKKRAAANEVVFQFNSIKSPWRDYDNDSNMKTIADCCEMIGIN